ncbi:sugar 1,4-lactone oxidase [Eremomyces bilateralis CBS 781.70]|uniref:D-arabinono-1,4-lactone oxidase n=1 Tax=Eremomyces bilateralis CBS 781.70 TaxID=1392243 RepID=A0A6G1G133_9PEZI|nr:sugar 1,4-lactone oxidase [Eremomyces bilateralis CBS 781.70]KAF1811728.1 sugar 1,4-lactone oxidase [Eremomyces bilateralis CBS 781.70]
MDAKLTLELSRLDPSIPFHASTSHHHHTWARTFHTRPELYIQPQSIEEIQKLITLARRCRRRIVVVGSAHSPSDLTCTSSWLVNLDHFNRVLSVDDDSKVMRVQAGIRLHDLNARAAEHGLTMPNLGSIDEQSIAGVMATGTHGSSLSHGLVSSRARALRIVLANGAVVRCSGAQNGELFRAALVSLGALGIIVEVEYEMVADVQIAWTQTIVPSETILAKWTEDLWTAEEFVRVWWLPYTGRSVMWRASKVDPDTASAATETSTNEDGSWYAGAVGYHTYHTLLYLAHYLPPLLPLIERFIFSMQYGFRNGTTTTGAAPQRSALLMDCLYSQLVNEWSLPLSRGPEALSRLTAWLNGDRATAQLPFDPSGVYIHAPIEVRVSDTTSTSEAHPRPFLDWSSPSEPTLFLNATLYRPHGLEPACAARYYAAFEYLMKSLGGRPHWAKNFCSVGSEEVRGWYGEDLEAWLRVRGEVDPEGLFVGGWLRRVVLGEGEGEGEEKTARMPLEERETSRWARNGSILGRIAAWARGTPTASVAAEDGRRLGSGKAGSVSPVLSDESFDVMVGAEVETSTMFGSIGSLDEGDEGGETDKGE